MLNAVYNKRATLKCSETPSNGQFIYWLLPNYRHLIGTFVSQRMGGVTSSQSVFMSRRPE
jgi:hypothetical protein